MDAADIVAQIVSDYRNLPSRETGKIRDLRREYSRRLKSAEPALILEVAKGLLNQSEFAFRFMAYELIEYHKRALASIGPDELAWLRLGVDSWYATDTFAPYVAGPAWREGQVPDELILGWARDADLWVRRTALVCTVALNNRARGGSGDPDRTLLICKELVDDREDMVVKAMSWALRELAKHHPEAVAQFVEEHKDRLAARVKREVANKLTTGLKSGKRRGL